jgi:hypothetical protein
MAKPSSQRYPPPKVTVMFEPHRLQHEFLQAAYTLLGPQPRRRLIAQSAFPVPPHGQRLQGEERSAS